jgi:hypothetical protein
MQKPWQAIEDEVTACKERIKGYEGDIRQVRDKGEVPELQQKLEAARRSGSPSSSASATRTRSTTSSSPSARARR